MEATIKTEGMINFDCSSLDAVVETESLPQFFSILLEACWVEGFRQIKHQGFDLRIKRS